MKLLIIGGTGPTGRLVVDRALEAGDEVTVLARSPEALDELAGRITVIQGDAMSVKDVSRAIQGQDAVVAALGTRGSLRADQLFSRAARAVVDAAQAAGVRRLVWLSSFGVGDTFKDATITQKLMYSTLLRDQYADKAVSEVAIRDSDLDWTIVYPTGMMAGAAEGTYRVDDRIVMKGMRSVHRADVAAFMHAAVHDTAWVRRDAVITN